MSERFVDSNSLSDQEVVAAYEQQDIGGEEVMVRLLRKVGLEHRSNELLIDEGQIMRGADGRELRAVDYLYFAGEKARPMILNFVRMDESHPQYPMVCKLIQTTVNDRLPPENIKSTE